MQPLGSTPPCDRYLNFIGNEFGHPEWLDFPRVENEQSYHYARRQWPLVDDTMLRYRFLNEFDRAMHAAEDRFPWLDAPQAFVSLKHDTDKVIVFERGSCIFAFNFNVAQSFTDYRIGAPKSGKYGVLLSTDFAEFGGHDRVVSPSPPPDAPDYHYRRRWVQLPPPPVLRPCLYFAAAEDGSRRAPVSIGRNEVAAIFPCRVCRLDPCFMGVE